MLTHKEKPSLNHYYLSGDDPSLLADIYQKQVQLINWQRVLTDSVSNDIKQLLADKHNFTYRIILAPYQVAQWLQEQWGNTHYIHLARDIEMLAILYADLFETAQVGLRFELVDKTLCPLFHVDKVLCRLVTTYSGSTTEWLEDDNTNRQALVDRQHDKTVVDTGKINHVSVGDVLLFKGQSWSDQAGEGVVHRSPLASPEQRRLILTLDII
jgi:hypothetical protein